MASGGGPAPQASRAAARADARGNYRLDVENFGPIVKAGVDLRPLTIFVGPSNTGKSYLAVLIYALHRCFGRRHPWGRALVGIRSFRLRKSIDRPVRQGFREWLQRPSDTDPTMVPPAVEEFLRSALETPGGLTDNFQRELRRCFGASGLRDLVRRPGRSPLAVDLHVPQNGASAPVRYLFSIERGNLDLTGTVPELPAISAEEVKEFLSWAFGPDESGPVARLDVALQGWLDAMSRQLLRPLFQPAYYLPADRTGVMHSHQVVVSTLLQSATDAGLRPSADIPMLSGVLADFLDGLIGMSQQPRRRRTGEKLAASVESEILRGAVRVERNETGYPAFSYRPQGWREDLPLMRASSMVSELAPVVLYLRHVVRPHDVLIIEEPEAHLHPGMQAAFARALARLVRSGVRVVMTTHSEWVLEQIGNLVRLSSVPETRRGNLAGADAALDPADVGAWLFKPSGRPKGSVVEEVVLDAETGLYRTDYASVSEALYNEGAAIFNRLQESDSR